MFHISVDSHHVDDSLHDNIRDGSSGDNGRHGSIYQDISHSSFHNDVESVDDDGRSGYRYQTISSPSHHSGELDISLGFSIHGHKRSVHRSQTSQFFSV